jgi:AcrR family transcriptional regulator
MSDTALTPDRILDVAEEVLRRYGPAKATVVDVARVLEVSHGSIYRHFPSKAALRDAVTARWLHRVSRPLAEIAAEESPAVDRLHRWLEQLIHLKRQKVLDDPELFSTYHAIAEESSDVVQAHIDELVEQLTQIIESGEASGVFKISDRRGAAKAVFIATMRFHHPAHAAAWSHPDIDADFAQVWRLVLAGLRQSEEEYGATRLD